MTGETRHRFHEGLRGLELTVQGMGSAASDLFENAMRATIGNDADLCKQVIAGDDDVDRYYLEVEQSILDLFALQTPVASDLRLLTVLLHINLHLERIGDMAVNIAKLSALATHLPRSQRVVEMLEEMGEVALKVVAASMEAFASRDVAACLRLPEMDDPIDRLNRGMMKEVLSVSHDQAMLEWGIRMHVVSRQIERVGDHGVDIGEQVHFLVTGEFKEFTDASH